MKGVCPICNKEFTKRQKTICCSRECAKKNKSTTYKVKKCELCGNKYESNSYMSKYCSDNCKRAVNKQQNIKRDKELKNLTLEEFWKKEAPLLTKVQALIKIENQFNVSPAWANLAYSLWRNRYVSGRY